jgi:hypothetical protein
MKSFNDRRKVTVGMAPKMDVGTIYIHRIAVHAIFWHWVDIRG